MGNKKPLMNIIELIERSKNNLKESKKTSWKWCLEENELCKKDIKSMRGSNNRYRLCGQ